MIVDSRRIKLVTFHSNELDSYKATHTTHIPKNIRIKINTACVASAYTKYKSDSGPFPLTSDHYV
jgi:hypothetical protein